MMGMFQRNPRGYTVFTALQTLIELAYTQVKCILIMIILIMIMMRTEVKTSLNPPLQILPTTVVIIANCHSSATICR